MLSPVRIRRDAIECRLQGTDQFRILVPPWPDPAVDRPDIVLLDLPRPDCFKAAQSVLRRWPSTSIVVIGLDDSEAIAQQCCQAGICWYLGDDEDHETLVRIIVGISSGEMPCSPRIAAILIRQAGSKQFHDGGLTPREVEILRCLQEGQTNKEIARRLGIRMGTVKNHVHNLLTKLQVPSRRSAARLALGREDGSRSRRAVAN